MSREIQDLIITTNTKITIHMIYRSQLSENELGGYQRIPTKGCNNTERERYLDNNWIHTLDTDLLL